MAEPLRVLEFYSGIGGLRYSLREARVEAVVVEAFEINEVANDVYEHNFGHRPSQGNIQRLTVRQLDSYEADTWILSPPCQPYTRQGLRKDAEDARAHSFLQILEMLPRMKFPPHHILVENVVGFENSITHGHLVDMLEGARFVTQEFLLTPLQLGIPYSRPRYFCLAKKLPKNFLQPAYNKSLLCELGPLADVVKLPPQIERDVGGTNEQDSNYPISADNLSVDMTHCRETPVRRLPLVKMNEPCLDPAIWCRPVSNYMEEEPCAINDVSAPPLLRKSSGENRVIGDLREVEITRFHEQETSQSHEAADKWEPYKVPSSVVDRWGDCFDIVTKDSRRCCCFTKSYGKYAKGTGSFLATKNVWEDQTQFEKSLTTEDLPKGVSLSTLGLRYFTPREVANLHSFPKDFTFPRHVSLKQRYALLGNSLSVAVVGALLRYLFAEPTQQI